MPTSAEVGKKDHQFIMKEEPRERDVVPGMPLLPDPPMEGSSLSAAAWKAEQRVRRRANWCIVALRELYADKFTESLTNFAPAGTRAEWAVSKPSGRKLAERIVES